MNIKHPSELRQGDVLVPSKAVIIADCFRALYDFSNGASKQPDGTWTILLRDVATIRGET